MIEAIPTFGGDISLAEWAMTAAMLPAGIALHELAHVAAFRAMGVSIDAELLPRADETSVLYETMLGTLVGIRPDGATPRQVVAGALAPLALAWMPVAVLAVMFQYPVVDVGTFMVVAMWFVTTLPSAADWATALGIAVGHPAVMVSNGGENHG